MLCIEVRDKDYFVDDTLGYAPFFFFFLFKDFGKGGFELCTSILEAGGYANQVTGKGLGYAP